MIFPRRSATVQVHVLRKGAAAVTKGSIDRLRVVHGAPPVSRIRIAHLSDLHLGPLPRPPLASLASKRVFGYLNWLRNRRGSLDEAILDALIEDIKAKKVDHVCVTGDLVNIALPDEYGTAAAVLARLGPPEHVSLVPGNHDAYVPGALRAAKAAWAPYMSGDDGVQQFPYLRRRGDVAFIGISTAVATPPLSARGRVGVTQRERLATLLDRVDDAYKVILIHHPPDDSLASGHRGLSDHAEVSRILSEGCADLILFGHNHEWSVTRLETPRGAAPMIGVPSASSDGSKHAAAGYALCDIETGTRTIRLSRRCYDVPSGVMRTTQQVTLEHMDAAEEERLAAG